MAVPVFVTIKKKEIASCVPPLTKASLTNPYSHMDARELEQPSRFKVQTRNTCSLPVESRMAVVTTEAYIYVPYIPHSRAVGSKKIPVQPILHKR